MGGAETSLRELLASLRAAEPEWELWLVLGEDGPLAGIARNLGVQVVVLPFPKALARIGDTGQGRLGAIWSLLRAAVGTVRYARKLSLTIRAIQPDLVHTNGFKMHLLGCWTRPRRIPLVWHIHDYAGTRPLMGKMLRLHGKHCAVAIVNSHSVAADVGRLIPKLPLRPIYNAIDLNWFAPQGNQLDLDAIAGLPPAAPGTVRVGLVGTFARWKGHKVFLQALSQLPAGPAIRAYIVGGPIYRTSGSQWTLAELREQASQLGLCDRVGFTGFLDDTPAVMRALDIVVHASTQPEPFGMVIIEGMACGKAVVVSRAGGAVELFEEERTALGHAPGDSAELARQIARLAGDVPLRERLGKAARAAAVRSFSGSRLARELLAVYRECHGEALAPATAQAALNS